MKTLGKFLGKGAYKNAYEVEGFPKQVGLVCREDPDGWGSGWDDKGQFKYLKSEHQTLSVLRKAGVPAVKPRIMRVYNPHLNKEMWALIVTRMKGSLHQLGHRSLTMGQWKSYLHTLRQLAKTTFNVTDLQFLIDDKKEKVVVNDPGVIRYAGSKENEKYYQDRWTRMVEQAERDFRYFFPGKEIP